MSPSTNGSRKRSREEDNNDGDDTKNEKGVVVLTADDQVGEEDDDAAYDVFGNDDDDDDDDNDNDDDSEEAEDKEDDQGSDGDILLETFLKDQKVQHVMNGGTYTFHLRLKEDYDHEDAREVVVQVYFRSFDKKESKVDSNDENDNDNDEEELLLGQEVGYLEGIILLRPSHTFRETAGEINGELSELAAMFCNPQGIIKPDFIDKAGFDHENEYKDKDEDEDKKKEQEDGTNIATSTAIISDDVYRGGFFHIYSMEIGHGHQGKEEKGGGGGCDLGLVMVHETLVFLKEEWVLTVMVPCVLDVDIQKWPEENNRFHINPRAPPGSHTQEQEQGLQLAHVKIKKHFARMGFQQAGRNSEQHLAWYLTSRAYFQNDNDSNDDDRNDNGVDDLEKARSRWKTKEQTKDLDIFVAPKKHVPIGIDAELHQLILNEGSVTSVVKLIERQLEGASIHNSRALFLAAADCNSDNNSNGDAEMETEFLLPTLIRLGGNAETADENGNTPLHVAATMIQPKAIAYLLDAGGAVLRDYKNDKQHTPLDSFEEALDSLEEFQQQQMAMATTMTNATIVNPKQSIGVLDAALLLMPEEMKSVLTDGWLPPRMKKMLELTAAHATEMTGTTAEELFSNKAGTVLAPLHEACFGGNSLYHIQYIPTEVLEQNPEGISKSFALGWNLLFRVIDNLLRNHQVPTVARIKNAILSGQIVSTKDKDDYNNFIEKGGKIEHALDAFITATRNVLVDGDDGWEYESYRDQIEEQPETSLDGYFDLVRVKCMELPPISMDSEPLGPHDHRQFQRGDSDSD